MHYTQFRFKNFKGIGEMTLPLKGGVTTLIGLNESGKTTILEAIFCFSYGAENLDVLDPSMASLRDPERWIPISLRSNFNDSIEIEAEVTLSVQDQVAYKRYMKRVHTVNLTSVPDTLGIKEKYIFENSRFVRSHRTWDLNVVGTSGRQRVDRNFHSSSSEWQAAVAYLKGQLPRIWYFPNFLFELPERFLLEPSEGEIESNEETDKSKFYRLTFDRILSTIGNGATLETHIVERAKSTDRTDQRNLRSMLLDMSRNMTKTVFEGWNRIFGRAPTGQEVELEAGTGDDGQAFLELKIKGPDGYYDLSERSLGFRWFFMFLLLTSYRDVGEGPDLVFLLDEPASNLHSSAQAELLKSFEKLAERCTLVYTTHSHHLINVRWLDSAFVVKNDALADFHLDFYLSSHVAAQTSISATPYRTFVAMNPDRTSYFQPVLDLLDYRPSSLEPVPRVVLVEGKSDFYLLRYAIDVLGVVPDLKLAPGTGAGTLDTLIRLYVGWGKSFLVLLDGDAEGKRQKARYENEFGPIMDGRCTTLPVVLEDPDVKEVEDLLDAEDRERLIGAIYGTGVRRPRGKKALAQAVIELYARREAIAIGEPSLSRIAELVDKLDSKLSDDLSGHSAGSLATDAGTRNDEERTDRT